MNKLILATMMILVGCSTIPSNYKPISDRVDESLYVQHDEFTNMEFVRHKFFLTGWRFFLTGWRSSIPTEIYYAKPLALGVKRLRIKHNFVGPDWIFFDQAIWLDAKGTRLSFNFKSFDKETDVESGVVQESSDELLEEDMAKKILDLLSTPGEKKIRLSGKYNKDYILEPARVEALSTVLKYYFDSKDPSVSQLVKDVLDSIKK